MLCEDENFRVKNISAEFTTSKNELSTVSDLCLATRLKFEIRRRYSDKAARNPDLLDALRYLVLCEYLEGYFTLGKTNSYALILVETVRGDPRLSFR